MQCRGLDSKVLEGLGCQAGLEGLVWLPATAVTRCCRQNRGLESLHPPPTSLPCWAPAFYFSGSPEAGTATPPWRPKPFPVQQGAPGERKRLHEGTTELQLGPQSSERAHDRTSCKEG